VKGHIPDLSEVADLMWMENALAGKSLDPAKRTALETHQKQALAGTLRRSELRAFKQEEKPSKDALAEVLATLQALRKKAGKVAGIPPEVLAHLDAAINLGADGDRLMVMNTTRNDLAIAECSPAGGAGFNPVPGGGTDNLLIGCATITFNVITGRSLVRGAGAGWGGQ